MNEEGTLTIKKLLPLLCAILLAVCSGRTAQAAVALADGVNPAEFAQFANEIFEDPHLISTLLYNARASDLQNTPFFPHARRTALQLTFTWRGMICSI